MGLCNEMQKRTQEMTALSKPGGGGETWAVPVQQPQHHGENGLSGGLEAAGGLPGCTMKANINARLDWLLGTMVGAPQHRATTHDI